MKKIGKLNEREQDEAEMIRKECEILMEKIRYLRAVSVDQKQKVYDEMFKDGP